MTQITVRSISIVLKEDKPEKDGRGSDDVVELYLDGQTKGWIIRPLEGNAILYPKFVELMKNISDFLKAYDLYTKRKPE